MPQPLVSAHGITKRFGRNVANASVDLQVDRGEVVAVVGENGAGKTTLMNILSGGLMPDAGTIRVDGAMVRFHSPRDALGAGIGMVHQHFALVPVMTVTENVVLGHEPGRLSIFDRRTARHQVSELSEHHHLKIDPDLRVERLSVGEQQRVEILKVLYRNARVLILDEPTAVLAPDEAQALLQVVRDLAAQGKSIIFISHKLKEVASVADRVVVLRNGVVVADVEKPRIAVSEIARLMVGEDFTEARSRETARPDPSSPRLEVQGITCLSDRGTRAVDGVEFQVEAGEILGIAGVEGNGQTELAEALSGVRHLKSGSIRIHLEARTCRLDGSPASRFRELGIRCIPEDRIQEALVPEFSIVDNVFLGLRSQSEFRGWGMIRRSRVRDRALSLIGRYSIKAPGVDAAIRSLSGGNQQKVVLARELSGAPAVLVVAQPTRGLDVGARRFVHEQLLDLRDSGAAIILISADLDEVLELADKVSVLFNGRLTQPTTRDSVDMLEIGERMAGHDPTSPTASKMVASAPIR